MCLHKIKSRKELGANIPFMWRAIANDCTVYANSVLVQKMGFIDKLTGIMLILLSFLIYLAWVLSLNFFSAISLHCLLFLKHINKDVERKGEQRTLSATELCSKEVINPDLVHLIFSQHNECICFAVLLSFVVKDTVIFSTSEDEFAMRNYFSLAFTQSNLTWRQHLSNNFLLKVKSLVMISSSTTENINLSETQLKWHWIPIFCLRCVRRMDSIAVTHWHILLWQRWMVQTWFRWQGRELMWQSLWIWPPELRLWKHTANRWEGCIQPTCSISVMQAGYSNPDTPVPSATPYNEIHYMLHLLKLMHVIASCYCLENKQSHLWAQYTKHTYIS